MDIAVRVIDFYEDYFGVRYPIPQSLNIALPDFSSGAMENWGLITYREIYLLVDGNSTARSRQNVALVVAHEIAHQWFGNLVTMKWWDDLWLNESFANMMEYVAINAIEPSWRIFEDFKQQVCRWLLSVMQQTVFNQSMLLLITQMRLIPYLIQLLSMPREPLNAYASPLDWR